MSILKIKNLSYSIGRKTILNKVNLEIHKKDSIVLRGDNGAGKSTLLKCIVNNSHHKESMEWNSSLSREGCLLSYLGHELGLYGSMSLKENLRFFHELSSGYSWKKIEDWVEMCNLHHRWEDPIYKFSRGMKQKAGFLRSILSKPYLLLLDEPFTGLDDRSYPVVLSILGEVNKDVAIVGVVHGMEEPFWKRILLLEKGILKEVE